MTPSYSRRIFKTTLSAVILGHLWGHSATAQQADKRPLRVLEGREPRPQDATRAILAAFEKYEVVGMPAAHGAKDGDDLILHLIRDPAFANNVDDIVVECGNSLYQPVLDRYIAGEDMPISEVRRVWRDTAVSMCSVSGFYEILFPLVRRINERRLGEKKLRVLAGDPPLDWSRVKDQSEVMLDRDANIAAVMEKEVLSKHRKALMLFGTFHLFHSDHTGPKQLESAVARYEMDYPGVTLVIGSGIVSTNPIPASVSNEMEIRMASWPVPSLVQNIKGTWLEGVDKHYFSTMADAFLYLGPTDLLLVEPRPAELFLNKEYMAELRRRAAIIGDGLLTAQTDPNNIQDEHFSPLLYERMNNISQPAAIEEQHQFSQAESPQKTLAKPQIVPLSFDSLAAFVGQYEAESSLRDKIQVAADAGGLWVSFGTGTKRRFLPLSSVEFFDSDTPMTRIEFVKNDKGQVGSLTFKGLWTTVAKKLIY